MDPLRYITALEVRVGKLESIVQRLLSIQTMTQSNADELMQMRALLAELNGNGNAGASADGGNWATATPPERPEMQAIREALREGNKMKAIALYRSAFGVTLQGAQAAIDAM